MTQIWAVRLALVLGGAMVLTGCEDGKFPSVLGKDDATAAADGTTRTVERDVEAPEVFQRTDRGLWDGRPSLGGVWVAHADATEPERVIIRNSTNGKFVVGVLYRPERQSNGPAFQVSSDAAEALGMLAGQPASLNVTALRRKEVPVDPPADATGEAPTEALAAAPGVTAKPLDDDPLAAAAAALDAAGSKPAPAPTTSGLAKPYVQIGIFSVKKNAENTAASLRQAGMTPSIKPGKMNGKPFWRVIVGPMQSKSERASILKKIKGLGFTDAYFVTN
ncbi:MAG: SPOR domain-containing protein [Rhodobacterales bacterium]|nr:MAG: SPOR domain-containing protein [Rhodobacterales bacterium]